MRSQSQSRSLTTQYPSDANLPYSIREFELVGSIFNQALESVHQSQSLTSNQESVNELDKMQIIKAYEVILRSQGKKNTTVEPYQMIGILPVQDSRVYNLVFKVLKKCEADLQRSQTTSGFESNLQQSLSKVVQTNESCKRACEFYNSRLKRLVLKILKQSCLYENSFNKENSKPQLNVDNSKSFISSTHKDRQTSRDYNMPLSKQYLHCQSQQISSKDQSVAVSYLDTSNDLSKITSNMSCRNTNTPSQFQIFNATQNANTYLDQSGLHHQRLDTANFSNIYDEIPTKGADNSCSKKPNKGLKDIQSFRQKFGAPSVERAHSLFIDHRPSLYTNSSYQSQNYIKVQDNSIFHQADVSQHVPHNTMSKYYTNPCGIDRSSLTHNHSQLSLSRTFRVEDDYRVLVKYLRLWEMAIKKIKKRRFQKERTLQSLATAIHFHEQSLVTKGLLSFLRFRYLRNKDIQNFTLIHEMVRRNVVKFYFRQMMIKFTQNRCQQSNQEVAAIHFIYTRRSQVLAKWSRVTQIIKSKESFIQMTMHQRPSVVQILIQYIGQSIFQKDNIDVIEFHAYSLKNRKVLPQKNQQFNKLLEVTLIDKMRKAFQAWKIRVHHIAQFKNKVLSKFAQKYYNALNQVRINKIKLVSHFHKENSRKKYRVLESLKLRTEYKQELRIKGGKMQRRNRLKVFKKFFQGWLEQWQYYSHLMKESIHTNKLSRKVFLQKYFLQLKCYHKHRKTQHLKTEKAASHFFNKYAQLSLKGWRATSKNMERLRLTETQIEKERKVNNKDMFFKAWMRACYLQEMTRRLRKQSLLRNSFRALHKKVEFKQLQLQLALICGAHYNSFKLLRAFKEWSKLSQRSKRLCQVQRALERRQGLKLLSIALSALNQYRGKRQQEKGTLTLVRNHCAKSRMHRALKKLTAGVTKIKILRDQEKILRDKHNQRIQFQSLLKMAQKVSKKQHLQVLQQYYQSQRLGFILKFYFRQWHHRQSILAHKGHVLSKQVNLKQGSKVFAEWLLLALRKRDFKIRFHSIAAKKQTKGVRKIWSSWQQYASDRAVYGKLKKVSAFLFLDKLLKKHLGLLRKYTYVRRIKRNIRQIQDNRLLQSGWNKLRYNALRHSKIKQYEIGRTALRLTNIMHEWRRAIRRKSVLKDYQFQFKRWREERQKLQIVLHFQQIYEKGYQAVKAKENSSVHQMKCFKTKTILKDWHQYTAYKKGIKGKQHLLQEFREKKVKYQALKEWRTELYLQVAEQTQAMPFRQLKLQQLEQQCLRALQNYTDYKKTQRQNELSNIKERAQKRMRSAISALFFYSQRQIELKSKLKSFSKQKQSSLKAKALLSLSIYLQRKQDLREKFSKATEVSAKTIRRAYLTKWGKSFDKLMRIKPLLEQADALQRLFLAVKTFRSFRQHHTYLQGKKEIYKSVQRYRQDLQLQKTFKVWVIVHQHERQRSVMREVAFVQFEKKFFKRWLHACALRAQHRQKQLQLQKLNQLLYHQQANKQREVLRTLHASRRRTEITKQAVVHFQEVFLSIQKRQSLLLIQKYSKFQSQLEIAETYYTLSLKEKGLASFRDSRRQARHKQKVKIQSEAFRSIMIKKKTLVAWKNHENHKRGLKQRYQKLSDDYRLHMLQKSFMTLQLNRMKHKYADGLSAKSASIQQTRLKQQLFSFLKKLLILKYLRLQVSEHRKLRVISSLWEEWRYQFHFKLEDQQQVCPMGSNSFQLSNEESLSMSPVENLSQLHSCGQEQKEGNQDCEGFSDQE